MSKAAPENPSVHEMVVKESKDELYDNFSDLESEAKQEKEDVSDSETVTDSPSSQGESQTIKDSKVEKSSRVEKKTAKNNSTDGSSSVSKARKSRSEASKKQTNASHVTPKKSAKSNGGLSKVTDKGAPAHKSKHMKVYPKASSESSEGLDDKSMEELKDFDILKEATNGSQVVGSDNDTADIKENGVDEDQEIVQRKIEEMELKIENLEEELREIAALEIALYSVVPEHGSSAHKVHTPARRLSRLYIHACKNWTQDKRATIARNTVSGLVTIAKACGNDVPRLTFWLSNTIVLREVISQAFGNSVHSSTITRIVESNSGVKRGEGKFPSLKWKGSPGSKQVNMGFTQFIDDWQETRTFTSALEKVESWMFSRIVESVWWQTLTPHMQSPVDGIYSIKNNGKVSGPTLGDPQQGDFAINLWQRAFQDAFQRLCPVRAGGHECGCLPVLARMVMELCVARLDVAMFNAILRESAEDIPTDPISDPIVDSKVLPIPSGDLSFGSGAQLKNSVGNWSRWLTDLFGMDTDQSSKTQIGEEDDNQSGEAEPQSFRLLNALSDLLMLPKDLLMDRSIRKEVCPSIGLPLIKRVLCNFTPDEFCPDAVPGAVLEALNAESFTERRLSDAELSSSNFPYSADPVVYTPPSPTDVAKKVGDTTGGKSQLGRNVSIIQRKGYTSDEELEELESPLTSIIDKTSPSTPNGNGENASYNGATIRYQLLREVWTL